MWEDTFGSYIPDADTRWIEPAWKMLLSNKAILALLWEMHKDDESVSKFLVPAYFDEPSSGKYVKKPLLSREGHNIQIIENKKVIESVDGDYDTERVVYQQFIEGIRFDNCLPMIGLWMVGNDCVGLGIREDDGLITGNDSRFIPHVFYK
ncbi:glutathionylspermidine synthase family protein [Vibrio vulnificus]|nr:glutathionylspermidine synthase family protein [Vibrio vulnificus]